MRFNFKQSTVRGVTIHFSSTATVFIDQTFETEAFFDEKALRTFVREKHYLPIQAGKNIFIIYYIDRLQKA